MESFNCTEKGWIKSIRSENTKLILSTLHEIRNSGSVKMLPILFELINNKTDAVVRNEIIRLLSDLKNQDAVPLIVDSINKQDFGEYLPTVVAACWQSGLDFSDHLRSFANLFIHADFITSLEAFTVIEESISHASDSERIECIRYLRNSECMVTDEKLPLFRELRKVIEIN
jgi:hypothetical protein